MSTEKVGKGVLFKTLLGVAGFWVVIQVLGGFSAITIASFFTNKLFWIVVGVFALIWFLRK